jgi:nicotinamide-nucleotide amidase
VASDPGTQTAARGSTRAAIVTVGNELLYGETVDTNAAWLGRLLHRRGIRVDRRFTVGDVDEDIRDAVAAAMECAELVIVTGGLGPTPDDRTKAAVAAHLGRRIVDDVAARADVEARFRAAGFDRVPPLSEGQYAVPEGARVLRNPRGTAPGLLLEEGTVRIALFPGVPRELEAIVEGDFAAVLDGLAGAPVHHRVVHTTGIFETRLAEALEPAIQGLPRAVREGVGLAYLPDLHGVDLRLTVSGGTAEEADSRFDVWLQGTDSVLAPWRFTAPSGDLAEAVVDTLRDGGWTVAVAESCTGGLLGARLTAIPGASEVFPGGVVAYANAVKVAQLGVDEAELERWGAVSESVARQMAEGAARRFGADAGVGITGVAGPGGGTDRKPVGTVWIAISVLGDTEAFEARYPGDRAAVRARAAQGALAALYRRLRELRRD